MSQSNISKRLGKVRREMGIPLRVGRSKSWDERDVPKSTRRQQSKKDIDRRLRGDD